jgi:hypothetical protein
MAGTSSKRPNNILRLALTFFSDHPGFLNKAYLDKVHLCKNCGRSFSRSFDREGNLFVHQIETNTSYSCDAAQLPFFDIKLRNGRTL